MVETVPHPASMHPPLKGAVLQSEEVLPALIGERRLSQRALEFGRNLPSFTKGQLAFYALQKTRITQDDADAMLKGDQAALGEYAALRESSQPGKLGHTLGQAMFVPVMQAYQPRINRIAADFHSAYSFVNSTIKGDEFIERVREVSRDIIASNRERAGHRTVVSDAIRHNIVPIIALGEMLHDRGVESPITLTLPEVYFKLVRWYQPKVFKRLQEAHEKGALDVGFSNAHHSLAPLLAPDDLEREYEHSLRYYLEHFKPKNNRVSLHIPEQAKTEDLLVMLTKLQRKHKVELIPFFDSRHHNPGCNLAAATHFKFESPEVEFKAFVRGFNASQHLAFGVVNGGDPLTEDERKRGVLEGLTPEREIAWAGHEGARIFGVVVSEIFGSEYNNRTWRTPLYEGKNSALVVEADAEWLGYHNRGEPYAFFMAVDAMREFGIEVASAQKALDNVELVLETRKRPHDASWSELAGFEPFYKWRNPKTQQLRDLVGKTLTAFKKPLLDVTDMLAKKFPDKTEDQLPLQLKFAWENYGNSLISCPYWWSLEEPTWPENTPTVQGLFHNMALTQIGVDKMITRMLRYPQVYHLDEAERPQLETWQNELRQSYTEFLNDPWAREHQSIREVLDDYKNAVRTDGSTDLKSLSKFKELGRRFLEAVGETRQAA